MTNKSLSLTEPSLIKPSSKEPSSKEPGSKALSPTESSLARHTHNAQVTEPVELFKMFYVTRMEYKALTNPKAFSNIVELAKTNHDRTNICCMLCFHSGYFIEYAEGSEKVLTEIKNRILKSERFRYMKILDFSHLTTPLLSRPMKVIHLADVPSKFNKPYNWNEDTQQSFIELLQQCPDDNRDTFNFLQLYWMRNRLLFDIIKMRFKSTPPIILLPTIILLVLLGWLVWLLV